MLLRFFINAILQVVKGQIDKSIEMRLILGRKEHDRRLRLVFQRLQIQKVKLFDHHDLYLINI